jgi:uncharacterized membrane protein YccC
MFTHRLTSRLITTLLGVLIGSVCLVTVLVLVTRVRQREGP